MDTFDKEILYKISTRNFDEKDEPTLVQNFSNDGDVFSSLYESMRPIYCTGFLFSVAFIKRSGISAFKSILYDLDKLGVRGKILTTDYLFSTEPEAIRELMNLKNIEIRFYQSNKNGFHTKFYLFEHRDNAEIYIGSSNLTAGGIFNNVEWNNKITCSKNDNYYKNTTSEFNKLWNESIPANEYIDIYEKHYIKANLKEKPSNLISIQESIKPNSMQINFIANLRRLIESGAKKALLISSTGTGKTYASAFACKDLKFKKILYIVHRETILRKALDSFTRVYGNDIKSGFLVNGEHSHNNKDVIFASIATIHKDEYLKSFPKNYFDIVIIDEVHRAAAQSYTKVINYFTPKLYLGMTATPERTDGQSIYNLFDHNVACEIRLQDAIENNYVCTFHYYGIKDLIIDNIDYTNDTKKFNFLISDKRVDYILKQASYYGHCGTKVKGLVFCSSVNEAKELSKLFNSRGYRTIKLDGTDNEETRERAISEVQEDDLLKPYLDYIFTYDIFNEGIDIPEINQIILLRPTESLIVQTQQIGRGLRKAYNKEYLTILDFIGNYKTNFLIPVTFVEKKVIGRTSVREKVEKPRIGKSGSTVTFDQISKERIYQSIDTASFNSILDFRKRYEEIKDTIGRIPTIKELYNSGNINFDAVFMNPLYGSYESFLKKYDADYDKCLSAMELRCLEYVSKYISNGKRKEEIEIYQSILNNYLLIDYDYKLEVKTDINSLYENIQNVINCNFDANNINERYKNIKILKEVNNRWILNNSFRKLLNNKDFYDSLKNLIDFGNQRSFEYKAKYKNTPFVLNQTYTRYDICRLMGWKKNIVGLNMGGYYYDNSTNSMNICITYSKANFDESIKYEDHFIDRENLIYYSKNKVTKDTTSKRDRALLDSDKNNVKCMLFVRKNSKDEFYFLGQVKRSNIIDSKETKMPNGQSVVKLLLSLNSPVENGTYSYLTKVSN